MNFGIACLFFPEGKQEERKHFQECNKLLIDVSKRINDTIKYNNFRESMVLQNPAYTLIIVLYSLLIILAGNIILEILHITLTVYDENCVKDLAILSWLYWAPSAERRATPGNTFKPLKGTVSWESFSDKNG